MEIEKLVKVVLLMPRGRGVGKYATDVYLPLNFRLELEVVRRLDEDFNTYLNFVKVRFLVQNKITAEDYHERATLDVPIDVYILPVVIEAIINDRKDSIARESLRRINKEITRDLLSKVELAMQIGNVVYIDVVRSWAELIKMEFTQFSGEDLYSLSSRLD